MKKGMHNEDSFVWTLCNTMLTTIIILCFEKLVELQLGYLTIFLQGDTCYFCIKQDKK